MASLAIRRLLQRGETAKRIAYFVLIDTSSLPQQKRLMAHSGPGDAGEQVITIMLPDEG